MAYDGRTHAVAINTEQDSQCYGNYMTPCRQCHVVHVSFDPCCATWSLWLCKL